MNYNASKHETATQKYDLGQVEFADVVFEVNLGVCLVPDGVHVQQVVG